MSFNSTLAALVCNLKVCIKHNKPINRCRFSKLNISVLAKLVHNGIVKNFKVEEIRPGIKEIHFEMVSISGEILLNDIQLVSKPGQRIYTSSKFTDIGKHMSFFNCALVSTTCGILNNSECTRQKLGGELLLVYR